ncbi:EAL domain-containing protein [Paracoccus aestuariivivens]|uniref:EAL domain-containing protein n=1 Tax=Paracoccus aestuariivivens TaxID=1820333 RepID=A0A6L6J4W0_9RHOB|nr:EAL domain-containing protein [Paracoccus aestuariivivens]MTH76288.1 EAL domain-containing protein [Paracoccus aestuariivivens]
MVVGFRLVVGRLRQAIRWSASIGKARSVLVLRLLDADRIRASLGPALFERLLDNLTLRLTIGLGLEPRSRGIGSIEIAGVLPARSDISLPQRVALLGRICSEMVDLGNSCLAAKADGVIVRGKSAVETDLLLAYGHGALSRIDPAAAGGTMQVLDYVPERKAETTKALPSVAGGIRFQPQICCDTGRLIALRLEPLVNLEDGQPVDRILDTLRHGFDALRHWQRSGHDVPFLSLHLSERDLSDELLVDRILWELDRHDLTPSRIEIEFSEPADLNLGLRIQANLRRLADAGCRIAVGDFGTGSAGLDHLRGYGVRRVRVGRSFIVGSNHRSDQQRMILAILALAESLDLEVLGDGVTTVEERSFLSQIGFSALQGSAVAPIMSHVETGDFLVMHKSSLPQNLCLGRSV